MLQAFRVLVIALAFAAAIIGASWVTKGLGYQNYVDMGLYAALIVWLGCEAAWVRCSGGAQKKLRLSGAIDLATRRVK